MYLLKRLLCPLILIQLIGFNVYGQKSRTKIYYPEAGNWEQRKPADVGMNALVLQDAVSFAIGAESKTPKDLKLNHYQTFGKEPFGVAIGPFKERGPAAGLIIKNGYIVAQWGDPGRVDQTFSVAKSFLSSTIGIAYDRGLIADIDDPVYKYMAPIIPYDPFKISANKSDALTQNDLIPLFETDHNRKITWNHMLRQTSDWEGTLWGKPEWADRPAQDVNTWTTRKRVEPGSVYEYNDVRVNVLALAAMNIWRKPLPAVLKENLMDLIGASGTWRWLGYENSWVVMDGVPMQAVSGGSHWGGGLYINAFDQARFGYLTMNKGKWKDKQVLSEKWITMAMTPTPAQTSYGFMNYFLNTDKKMLPSAPASAYFHLGAGNNMIYVDRDHNLMIVARWIENKEMDGLVQRVLKSIE
jgi:CubicO group peptidase (beta-lactamase class C family)